MTIVTPRASRSFIKTAKLPAIPLRKRRGLVARALTDTPPVELKSTEAQSLVAGSGLIVAAANVPKQTTSSNGAWTRTGRTYSSSMAARRSEKRSAIASARDRWCSDAKSIGGATCLATSQKKLYPMVNKTMRDAYLSFLKTLSVARCEPR